MLGPFHIIERIYPVAFRLDVPSRFRIHDVFYASTLLGRQLTPVPAVELETGDEYEVEEIPD